MEFFVLSSNHRQPSVIVLDAMVLRRAAFLHFLQGWAEAHRLGLVELSAICADTDADIDCRMILVVLGGSRVADSSALNAIQSEPHFKNAPSVVVSDLVQVDEVVGALRLGARGYLPTSMDPNVALAAMTYILEGGEVFPSATFLAASCEQREHAYPDCSPLHFHSEEQARAMFLTARQQQVAELLRRGLPNKLIARQLDMAEATVKVHVRQIMHKLGVTNRTQAALCALPGQ